MTITTDRSAYYKRWKSKNPDQIRELNNQACRKWRADNPKDAKAISARYRESRRKLLNDLKAKPCLDCGNSFPPECMDYDHVRGKKVCGIYQMYTKSIPRLLAEIAKCDLVCSNCHRIRTCKRKPPIWARS